MQPNFTQTREKNLSFLKNLTPNDAESIPKHLKKHDNITHESENQI